MSYFTAPENYRAIKESFVTSPSVEIVNRMLLGNEADFPKAMILDMFLSFGVFGLLATAVLLGSLITWVQRNLNGFHGFTPAFLVSLYVLPMLLEFEKEFIGFVFAFMKWIPMLVLLYLLRPRFRMAAWYLLAVQSPRPLRASGGAA